VGYAREGNSVNFILAYLSVFCGTVCTTAKLTVSWNVCYLYSRCSDHCTANAVTETVPFSYAHSFGLDDWMPCLVNTYMCWKPLWGRGTHLSPLSIYFSIFSPFYFFLSFVGFTYFLFLSIPSLSTRIVPLRFQAGGRRRRPILGLVSFFVFFVCVICVICIP